MIFCISAQNDTLLSILKKSSGIRVSDKKIVLPTTISRIRLDIGLSYSAPISQQWLSQNNDLIVFGFEPNPESVASIQRGAHKQHPSHGEPLDPRSIGTRFFLIPCALGTTEKTHIPFYITAGDCGCSSRYRPVSLPIEKIIEVPIFPLNKFFEHFPFDTHPFIEYIKIDAQGADLDIVQSGGNYIAEHVLFITIEAEDTAYYGTNNSVAAIEHFMQSIGFMPYYDGTTHDPTYYNTRFREYIAQNPVVLYQQ
jgi:hypothetical protein